MIRLQSVLSLSMEKALYLALESARKAKLELLLGFFLTVIGEGTLRLATFWEMPILITIGGIPFLIGVIFFGGGLLRFVTEYYSNLRDELCSEEG